MTANDNLIIDTDESITHVCLNRPDKHNGMHLEMLEAVNSAARQLKDDRSVRSIVISGNGPSFCAGLDFAAVLKQPVNSAAALAQLWLPYANRFQRWSLTWREIGAPVVAAIHGNCFGAGLQLALGADVRVATPHAKLSVMETKWGLIPDMGGAVLLRELVPIDVAKELTMSARVIDGSEAHALGLVTHLADDPMAKAQELATEMSHYSPDAVAAAKFLLQESWQASDSEAAAAERKWQRRLIGRSNQRISLARNKDNPDKPYEQRSIK